MSRILTIFFLFVLLSIGKVFAQSVFATNNSSITASRLIAHTNRQLAVIEDCPDIYYNKEGDSIRYVYSGIRGGDLSSVMKYDSSKTYGYDSATNSFYGPAVETATQTFDRNNNILGTYFIYTNEINGTPIESGEIVGDTLYTVYTGEILGERLYTYDDRNNLLTSASYARLSDTSWQDETKYIYTYNENNTINSLITQCTFYYNYWQNASENMYIYNAHNKPIQVLLQRWDSLTNSWLGIVNDTSYSYDNENRVDMMTVWDYNETPGTYSYTYDNAGHLTKLKGPAGQITTYANFYNNLPQLVVSGVDTTYYTYNTYGQITSTISGSDTDRYYYETYLIPDTSINANGVNIYPNPAMQQITVAYVDMIKSLVVYNLQGQIVSSGKYNTNVVEMNIAYLPPAVYLVMINGANVRRFVKK